MKHFKIIGLVLWVLSLTACQKEEYLEVNRPQVEFLKDGNAMAEKLTHPWRRTSVLESKFSLSGDLEKLKEQFIDSRISSRCKNSIKDTKLVLDQTYSALDLLPTDLWLKDETQGNLACRLYLTIDFKDFSPKSIIYDVEFAREQDVEELRVVKKTIAREDVAAAAKEFLLESVEEVQVICRGQRARLVRHREQSFGSFQAMLSDWLRSKPSFQGEQQCNLYSLGSSQAPRRRMYLRLFQPPQVRAWVQLAYSKLEPKVDLVIHLENQSNEAQSISLDIDKIKPELRTFAKNGSALEVLTLNASEYKLDNRMWLGSSRLINLPASSHTEIEILMPLVMKFPIKHGYDFFEIALDLHNLIKFPVFESKGDYSLHSLKTGKEDIFVERIDKGKLAVLHIESI